MEHGAVKQRTPLSTSEARAVVAISFTIALRMLGIFLVLPIFSTHALAYPGATMAKVGLAFGVYPLMQALFQLPFGMLSDKKGRRFALSLGLACFGVGSVLCGLAQGIHGLILARALQGTGAVGAVALAAIGDVTRPEVRAQAFTITGMTIGMAFMLGVLAGPMLAPILGLKGLFFLLAGFSVIGELFVARYFPNIPPSPRHIEQPSGSSSWNRQEFLRIYLANFVLALTLNALFFLLPLEFISLGISKAGLGKAYLMMILPAGILAFPFVRRAERLGSLKLAAWTGFALVILGFLGDMVQSLRPEAWILILFSGVFFFGYTIEQALLPAFLTQKLEPKNRGRITGVYNLCAFLGSAFGGILSGLLYPKGAFLPFLAGTLALALMGVFGLPMPERESN